jgi:glycogen(starch) synthase
VRIVFLSEQYPPYVVDGAGTYTATVARALAAIGHEVHVLCAKGTRIRDEHDAGVHVHRRPPLRVPLAKLPGALGRRFMARRDSIGLRFTLALSYAFWLRVLDLRPDVIETQDGETRAIFNALMRDVPLLIHLHTPTMLDQRLRDGKLGWKGRFADALDRVSARRADELTAPSELMAQTLRHCGWIGAERPVSIIPLPFDASRYADVCVSSDTTLTILAVGRLEWRKAPDTLLAAVSLLKQRGIDPEVVFAGKSDGEIEGLPWDRWVEQRARQTGIRCTLTGMVDSDRLRELYGRARVVAVPSRFDNFPTVVLEAMAAGRPVVTTSTTGVARLVSDARAGAVVAPDDPSALAQALAPFLTDATLAEQTGERGREALHVLTPIRIARLREQAYLRAIERNRQRKSGAPEHPMPLDAPIARAQQASAESLAAAP